MRILYVEDNDRDADFVRRALAREQPPPQELRVAPTLAAARAALAGGGWDVVLADLNLPDGHGLELLGELAASPPAPLMVALTGQGDESTVLAVLKAGADDYLPKSEG